MIEERDDFGEDEPLASTAMDQAPDLTCTNMLCSSKSPLRMDSTEGYYVCTECGTIANAAVFEDEVVKQGNCDEIKRRTFLKINGMQEEPDNGTSVPYHLRRAQRGANAKYRERKKERANRIARVVRLLFAKLNLPPSSRRQVEQMVGKYMDTLETQRRNKLNAKTQDEQNKPFDVKQFYEPRLPKCVDCNKLPEPGKQWKKRAGCRCYICPKCDEADEFDETHKCKAPPASEHEHKRRLYRRAVRNESRTLVNAYISISAACAYLHAQHAIIRRLRWKNLVLAVYSAFGRTIRRETITRWAGKIKTALCIPDPTPYQIVMGFANRFLDELPPATEQERLYASFLISTIMRRKKQISAHRKASLRAVIGRVYELLMDAITAAGSSVVDIAEKKEDAVNLHHRQPWVLAAVCVYLILHVERSGDDDNRPKIADLCAKLHIDPSSFQKCKRHIVLFI